MKTFSTIVSVSLAASLGISAAQGAVTNVSTVNIGNRMNITSTTLSDGRTFSAGTGLLGVDLFHYRGTATTVLVSPESKATLDANLTKSDHLEDLSLNTGVVNPGRAATGNLGITVGTSPTSANNGIGLSFLAPLFNGPGEDFIFIEFSADSGQAADPFVVTALTGGSGFGATSAGFATVSSYEFSAAMLDNFAYTQTSAATSLNLLDTRVVTQTTVFGDPFYRAVAIDLSDLGVAPGAFATGLFIQSTAGSGAEIDPVFIAGLVTIPEPMTAGLGVMALAALTLRGRRSRSI